MTRKSTFALTLVAALIAAGPALAHHVMGGRMPATFMEGFLSGLGHPVIGLDHFAAVVAIGCLAAAHAAGIALVVGYVAAMMAGVAVHVTGASVPASEILVALSVIGLGSVLLTQRALSTVAALAIFALVGLLHGYALGESIFGAERTPLFAYLAGLAVIQIAVALAAMSATRVVAQGKLRLAGGVVTAVGLFFLVQEVIAAV